MYNCFYSDIRLDMKLLGSVRFPAPDVCEALRIAKRRRENVTHEMQNDQIETIIQNLNKSNFCFEIFQTHNSYDTWLGNQKYTYHDELRIELITTG